MKISKDATKSWHYMTDKNIVLHTKQSGQGEGDSLGRTIRAAWVYEEDREKLIEGVKSFFFKRKNLIYVTRYPGDNLTDYLRGNSRDHVIKTITIFKLLGEHEWIHNFLEHKAHRPCIEHPYTPQQKIWFKAIYSKFWSWIFLIISLPWLLFQLLFDSVLRWLGRYKLYETVSEYNRANVQPTKIQKLFNKIMLPTFASFYTIISVQALESKTVKKIMQRLILPYFEKTNYVGRALCGKKIPNCAIDSYTPTHKNRWSTRLDASNNRDLRQYPHDTPENNLELGMLHGLKKLGY